MRLNLEDGGPLYRQIAGQIAYDIATGRLRPGSVLPSLRQAQAAWGVHLHTVRRAYLELQLRGLVRIRERGPTVVLGAHGSAPGSLRESVVAFLSSAAHDFAAAPADVVEAIHHIVDHRPRVPVLECSRTLAGAIGDQLARAWRITPMPILLGEGWPADRLVVSTFFHRHDLLAYAKGNGRAVEYLRLRLSPRLLRGIARRLRRGPERRVAICETDAGFAERVAAELRARLHPGIGIRVRTPADITRFVDTAERDALKLVSPRHWDRLAPDRRAAPDLMLLEFDVDPADVEDLGRRLGWRRDGATAST